MARALGRHKPSYSHNPISDIADNTTIAMQQKVRAAEAKLEGELQRTATVEELAQHMEMNQAQLESWQARFQASKVKSLDEVYTDHSLLFEDVTPLTRGSNPPVAIARYAKKRIVKAAGTRSIALATLLCRRAKRLRSCRDFECHNGTCVANKTRSY
jgi:hypothetical protein